MRSLVCATYESAMQRKASHFVLGKDKAQCLTACFLILPV